MGLTVGLEHHKTYRSDIRVIIQVHCCPYFTTPMCRTEIADHMDMHMTYINPKILPQIIDVLLMHSPECTIEGMAQLPYTVIQDIRKVFLYKI